MTCWHGNRSIPVILQDGDYAYVYGIGLISTTDNSGNQTYRLTDGLGSTVGLCDGSGTVVATYVYDAYGIIKSQTGTSDNYFLYTGEQRDSESGYDYLRARYYDSAVGRFLGKDAAAPDWKAPSSLNRFAYVLNNPLNLVDPSGLEWVNVIECSSYDEEWNCLATTGYLVGYGDEVDSYLDPACTCVVFYDEMTPEDLDECAFISECTTELPQWCHLHPEECTGQSTPEHRTLYGTNCSAPTPSLGELLFTAGTGVGSGAAAYYVAEGSIAVGATASASVAIGFGYGYVAITTIDCVLGSS